MNSLKRFGKVGNLALHLVLGILFSVFGWILIIDIIFKTRIYLSLQWWQGLLALLAMISGTISFGPLLIWESWKIYKGKEVG